MNRSLLVAAVALSACGGRSPAAPPTAAPPTAAPPTTAAPPIGPTADEVAPAAPASRPTEAPARPERRSAAGEPTDEIRKKIYDAVMSGEDPETSDVAFTRGQVGAGALKSAARVERTDGKTTVSWLLVEGPRGWARFEDPLLESLPEMDGRVTMHKELASRIVPDDPELGAVLVIDVLRENDYGSGRERQKVRWYCFVRADLPTCVEVTWAVEEGGDAGEADWARVVELDKGDLVIGKVADGALPSPAAGRYALKTAAGVEGLVVRTAVPVSGP